MRANLRPPLPPESITTGPARQAQPRGQAIADWLALTAARLRAEMPVMNNQVHSLRSGYVQLVTWARTSTDEAVRLLGVEGECAAEVMGDPETAMRVLALLGFFVSSVEKAVQELGLPPGAGLAMLPGVEGCLLALGRLAQHPPRDTHYTYWLLNRGPNPITFTGDRQETKFNEVVNLTDDRNLESLDAMRPICEGTVDIFSPEAAERLWLVARNNRIVYESFRSIMARDPTTGRRAIEPHFFMTIMRVYLATYPVGGVDWGGVNAANLMSAMAMDYALGTFEPWYGGVLATRWRYMTLQDQEALEATMERRSAAGLIVERIGLTPAGVQISEPGKLKAFVGGLPSDARRTLLPFEAAVQAYSSMTAFHSTLIENYLVKAATQLTEAELARMPVKPSAGTGGMGHEETMRIRDMRRLHEVIKPLMEAFKTVGKAQGRADAQDVLETGKLSTQTGGREEV
jgi:Domain of unknown function (DUF1864)